MISDAQIILRCNRVKLSIVLLNMTYWIQLLGIISSFLVLNTPLVADVDNPLSSASSIPEGPISFDSPEGKGASVVLYRSASVENTGEPLPPPDEWPETQDRADFDFAHLSSGGKVLYVSSNNTDKTFQMVDGAPDTFFDFGVSGGGAFFLVSLAETYPIYKASISTTKPIRRVEMWAFNSDPEEFFRSESSSSDSDVNADPSGILLRRAPTGQIDVSGDEDVTSLTISIPETTARYLLVRVVVKNSSDPIQVSLFSVFGDVPREYLGNRWGVDSPQPYPDAPQIPVASP